VATSRTTSLLIAGQGAGAAQVAGTHFAFGVATTILAAGALLAAVLIDSYRPASAMPLPEAPTGPAEPDPVPAGDLLVS
jgi:ABC-type hemin transport system substrate-binding protein